MKLLQMYQTKYLPPTHSQQVHTLYRLCLLIMMIFFLYKYFSDQQQVKQQCFFHDFRLTLISVQIFGGISDTWLAGY